MFGSSIFLQRLWLPIFAWGVVNGSLPASWAGIGGSASVSPEVVAMVEGSLPQPEKTRHGSLVYPVNYVLVYHSIGLLALNEVDRHVTNWDSFGWDTFKEGWSEGPRWDPDEWLTNYVGHPLWGSETYLRARSQNFSPWSSFLFSTASSVVWEYVFENWATHPSQQDLLFTSTLGSVLGEFRYRVIQPWVYDRRKVVGWRGLLDPLQTVSMGVGQKFFKRDWLEPAYAGSRLRWQAGWSPWIKGWGDELEGVLVRVKVDF